MCGLVAALFTRMSTRPKRFTVACTHASAWSGSPALAANTSTSPSISAAAFSSCSCFRDDNITLAPDSAIALAIANPIPFDAPVTSAVSPSSRSSMAADSRPGRDSTPGSRPAEAFLLPGVQAGGPSPACHGTLRHHRQLRIESSPFASSSSAGWLPLSLPPSACRLPLWPVRSIGASPCGSKEEQPEDSRDFSGDFRSPKFGRVNRLADETSPYLRQHADNPVDWYPWGADA